MNRIGHHLVGLLAALALHAPLAAQEEARPQGFSTVTGRVVVAETGEPLATVSVELLFASDSVQAGGAVTDAGGRFRLERMPEGVFVVRLTSIGYGTVWTEPFEVAEAEVRELGALPMPVEAVALEPITVSPERTVVTYEADRTAYNIGVMPGTEGASVTEALAMIPELEVGVDGQVSLRNADVRIYIDGRETPMEGEALAVFLEQFPAEYLQKIEVLDNPSARYDAEGAGGIVNLVTKEGVELGLSGTIFASAGTRGDYGLGGRGTFQRGEWTVDGGGFLRLSDWETTGYQLRQNLDVDPAFLRQDSWSDRSGLGSNVDLEVRYDPTERTRLYAEGRWSGWGNDSDGLTTTTHLDALESPILLYDRSRAAEQRNGSFDLSTGFEYRWRPRVHELQVELELERGTERQNSREEITDEREVVEGELIPAELTLEDEEELETELSLEIDYVRPWGGGGEIEVGYEGERTLSDNERLFRRVDDPLSAPDGRTTDRGYEQRERTHALYATLERRFGDLSVEAGLRAEYVDLRFELPEGDAFAREYADLFPSANVSYRIDDDRHLRLSYSRRVERPRMRVLNPIDRSTDPLERRVGNPDIEPEFTHAFSLRASWGLPKGTLRFSPYYRTSRNGWAEITTVDDRGVSTTTWQNVASRESLGAALTYFLRERDGWRASISLAARHEDRDAGNLDARYSGSSLRFSSRANLNARVTDDLSGQVNFAYQPPTDLPQGRLGARYRADFGLRYQLLDDRAAVRVSLRDPFGLRGSSTRLSDLDYILIGESEESTRSVRLSVSYALGGGGEMRGGGRRWRRR